MNRSIVTTLNTAGLTGRGGAAFRTAIKVQALIDGADLIVNACDGEIGATKDAHVIAHSLDEVLYGIDLITDRPARFATHRNSQTAARLHTAAQHVLEVPHRYVSSEESSLVSAAAGGLARPLTKRQPIAFGATLPGGRRVRPTVVLNAETVWRIAQIEAFGADWFRGFGTDAEPGPRLVTVSGAVTAPGVVEVAAGIPLRGLIAAAGGLSGPHGAIGVSGLAGGWLRAAEAQEAVWSNADLRAYGLTTGSGVIHVLGEEACPLTTVRQWLTYAAGESAGQCGPCMFGVPALVADLTAVIDGDGAATMHRLRRRIFQLRDRGACRFPDGVASFAESVLRTFPDELAAHAAGRCPRCAGLDRSPRTKGRTHAVTH